jgi:hypothetical protein
MHVLLILFNVEIVCKANTSVGPLIRSNCRFGKTECYSFHKLGRIMEMHYSFLLSEVCIGN